MKMRFKDGLLPSSSKGKIDYRFQGFFVIDLKDNRDIEDLHYHLETENHGDFMAKLINAIKGNGDILRRYCGWFRLFLDKEGEEKPISFLMRKFNLYINAVHNGHKLFELGYGRAKFFTDVDFTGFDVTYKELFGSTSLIGIELGYVR